MQSTRTAYPLLLCLLSTLWSGAALAETVEVAVPEQAAPVTETAAVGKPGDADIDGVPDDQDRCPDTPQVQKIDPDSKYARLHAPENLSPEPMSIPVDADGCPLDGDKDGVPDYLDFCPEDTAEEISAGVHENGCPLQSDGDGTPDYRDKCPNTPRGVATDPDGCPK